MALGVRLNQVRAWKRTKRNATVSSARKRGVFSRARNSA
jgi:hypothetical protein